MNTYFENYVADGGPLMVALIPCALLVIGGFLQAMIRLRGSRVMPPYLLEKARQISGESSRAQFARELDDQTSPLAQSLRLTLRETDLAAPEPPERHRREATATESIAFVVDDMYEKLGIFSTLYTVGPLIGLLGTVLGMVKAFLNFGSQADQDLAALSNGIQEALVTTLWGLAIAIPAFLAAQYFQSRIRRYERIELPRAHDEIVVALFSPATASASAAKSSRPEEARSSS